jgi:metal-responsive CopG/Arc/MetJ family transcriptional regulator
MAKKERYVAFKDEEEIIELIDDLVAVKGINRSGFIREAIRKRLAEMSFFSEETKKALGVPQTSEESLQQLEQKEGA